jgi:hypothetical protein
MSSIVVVIMVGMMDVLVIDRLRLQVVILAEK